MLSAIRIRGLHGEAQVTAAGLVCTSCGTEASRGSAKYCDACGSLLADGDGHAEFKQVTVLFADVVRSMEIAATVGAERLREIMTGLVGRAVAVVSPMAAPWTSSPVTARWRCSGRPSRWRTTRSVRVWHP